MNSNEPFRVSISGATREKIRLLYELATQDERGELFLNSLRAIEQHLRTDPIAFGEDIYNLRQHRITVKIAIRLPIAVEFGVHVERRLALVRSFHYLPFAG